MAKKYESHESCDHPCNKAARAKCRRWRKMLRSIVNGDA